MTYQVDLRHLHAMAVLAADNDLRTYLNGVWLESSPAHQVLIATDGAALGALRTLDAEPGTPAAQVFIPRAVIAKLPKAKSGEATLVDIDPAGWVRAADHVTTWAPEGGRFPAWRRAIPRKYDHVPVQFDAHLLARFAKVNRMLGAAKDVSGWLHLTHAGDQGVLVRMLDFPNFAGVIASLREGGETQKRPLLPDFVQEPLV